MSIDKEKLKELIVETSYKYGVNFNRNCPFDDFGSDEETYSMKSYTNYYSDILKGLNVNIKSIETKEISDGVYDLIVNDNNYKLKSGNTLENVVDNIYDISTDLEKEFNDKHNKLVNSVIEYEKNYNHYEFQDCYINDEDAIEDISSHLSVIEGVDNMIETLCGDISTMAIEKGLSNNEIKKYSDSAYKLITELSDYKTYLNKDKEIENSL